MESTYHKWLSIQPLSEAGQNKLSMRFTVEYNYNSNHLEGNTLTDGQTKNSCGEICRSGCFVLPLCRT